MTNHPEPVIIVSGLPRSGTSMMMRMLSAGGVPVLTDGVRTADEDNPHGYFEFEPIKRVKHDASWLPGAAGKAVKAVYALLYDLPPEHHYRVILMRRPLEEVIASQDVMLRRRGESGGALGATQLMTAFRVQMDKVLEWMAARPNFEVLDVSYPDVLRDPARWAGEIDQFLGGGLDTGAMARAVDPSLHRNRTAAA